MKSLLQVGFYAIAMLVPVLQPSASAQDLARMDQVVKS
jgi:hypothetical protein